MSFNAISMSTGSKHRQYNLRWIGHQEFPESELVYLAWGKRRYGIQPIPLSDNTGWNYTVVLSGAPTVHADSEELRMRAGELAILSPELKLSFRDRGPATCEILTWIWTTPPHHLVRSDGQNIFRFPLDKATLSSLARLHASTREEIIQPDQWTHLALGQIRLHLDLILARREGSKDRNSSMRFRFAMDYIRQHPEIHDPLKAVSQYLQVSVSTVKRLFAQHSMKSAKRICHEHRMQTARRLLASEPLSVKQVAIELGYSHPGDFSRAYHSFFGHYPSSDRPGTKKKGP